MEEILKEVEVIDNWIDGCYKRSDLHDFHTLMHLGIAISNHVRKLTIITLCTMTENEAVATQESFKLHDAVIIGHLVRLHKLYDQLAFFVSDNKGEISSMFARPMFETFVIMKYLMMKGTSSIDNYIRVSFKSTIKQYKYIKDLEAKRELSDIEMRIVSKIENRIRKVGLDTTELIQNKNWRLDGLSFKGIVDYLMKHDPDPQRWWLAYDFLFGSTSSFVHGTWYDIELNHLTYSDGRYSAKLTYDKVDPRYILPQSFVPVMACIDFLNWRKSDPDNFLINVFNKMGNLLNFLNEMDEVRINDNKISSGAT